MHLVLVHRPENGFPVPVTRFALDAAAFAAAAVARGQHALPRDTPPRDKGRPTTLRLPAAPASPHASPPRGSDQHRAHLLSSALVVTVGCTFVREATPGEAHDATRATARREAVLAVKARSTPPRSGPTPSPTPPELDSPGSGGRGDSCGSDSDSSVAATPPASSRSAAGSPSSPSSDEWAERMMAARSMDLTQLEQYRALTMLYKEAQSSQAKPPPEAWSVSPWQQIPGTSGAGPPSSPPPLALPTNPDTGAVVAVAATSPAASAGAEAETQPVAPAPPTAAATSSGCCDRDPKLEAGPEAKPDAMPDAKPKAQPVALPVEGDEDYDPQLAGLLALLGEVDALLLNTSTPDKSPAAAPTASALAAPRAAPHSPSLSGAGGASAGESSPPFGNDGGTGDDASGVAAIMAEETRILEELTLGLSELSALTRSGGQRGGRGGGAGSSEEEYDDSPVPATPSRGGRWQEGCPDALALRALFQRHLLRACPRARRALGLAGSPPSGGGGAGGAGGDGDGGGDGGGGCSSGSLEGLSTRELGRAVGCAFDDAGSGHVAAFEWSQRGELGESSEEEEEDDGNDDDEEEEEEEEEEEGPFGEASEEDDGGGTDDGDGEHPGEGGEDGGPSAARSVATEAVGRALGLLPALRHVRLTDAPSLRGDVADLLAALTGRDPRLQQPPRVTGGAYTKAALDGGAAVSPPRSPPPRAALRSRAGAASHKPAIAAETASEAPEAWAVSESPGAASGGGGGGGGGLGGREAGVVQLLGGGGGLVGLDLSHCPNVGGGLHSSAFLGGGGSGNGGCDGGGGAAEAATTGMTPPPEAAAITPAGAAGTPQACGAGASWGVGDAAAARGHATVARLLAERSAAEPHQQHQQQHQALQSSAAVHATPPRGSAAPPPPPHPLGPASARLLSSFAGVLTPGLLRGVASPDAARVLAGFNVCLVELRLAHSGVTGARREKQRCRPRRFFLPFLRC